MDRQRRLLKILEGLLTCVWAKPTGVENVLYVSCICGSSWKKIENLTKKECHVNSIVYYIYYKLSFQMYWMHFLI